MTIDHHATTQIWQIITNIDVDKTDVFNNIINKLIEINPIIQY